MYVLFLPKELQLYSGTTLFGWQCEMCEEVVLYGIFTFLFGNYDSAFKPHLTVSCARINAYVRMELHWFIFACYL